MGRIEEVIDKIGTLCWLTTYSVVAYPLIDHKRIGPTFDKYINKLEELIKEYKRLKEQKIKEVL